MPTRRHFSGMFSDRYGFIHSVLQWIFDISQRRNSNTCKKKNEFVEFFTASCVTACLQVTHHMVLADTDSRPTIASASNDNIIVPIIFFSVNFPRHSHSVYTTGVSFLLILDVNEHNSMHDAISYQFCCRCQMWIEKKKHLLRTNGAHDARHLSKMNETHPCCVCSVHGLDANERHCVVHRSLAQASDYCLFATFLRAAHAYCVRDEANDLSGKSCLSRSHLCPPEFRYRNLTKYDETIMTKKMQLYQNSDGQKCERERRFWFNAKIMMNFFRSHFHCKRACTHSFSPRWILSNNFV